MILPLLWGKLLWVALSVRDYLVLLVAAGIAVPPTVFLVLLDRKKLSSLYDAYQFYSALPLGKTLFSTLVGAYAPYSASVSPTVQSMNKSDNDITVVVSFEDRPWLRNPFQSVHAVALTNIGECASGIAIVAILGDKRFRAIRGIPTRIDTTYFKKGRGTMTATAVVKFSNLKAGESKFETEIRDKDGELIAMCVVTWSFRDNKSATVVDHKKEK